MNSDSLHVAFSGGVTGGHLFPGLAVAELLRRTRRDTLISFVGTGSDLDRRHVDAAGFHYFAVGAEPAPRALWRALGFVRRQLAARRDAEQLIVEHGIDLVVGLGGYASVPLAAAAVRSGIPLILLEQNAVPGRATRWLARSATAVCVAFPPTRDAVRPLAEVRLTGNPLRAGFVPVNRLVQRLGAARLGHQAPQLTVLGGSRGARTINEQVPLALYRLRDHMQNWQIVHVAGQRDLETTRSLYTKLGLEADVLPFVDAMPEMLARTSIAVSRSGGTTLAELAATGVPSVLVPFPQAKDEHQRHNAEFFARAGAARIVEQLDAGSRFDERLAAEITALIGDPEARRAASLAMLRLAQPTATQRVAQVILELAPRRAARLGA
ncbi:MAG: UDP-N-acetylglucosamine--N-acetylmuramyl-(pentapeptide) pyrophosphoryl-undecaprenol N-acetylglucosamine transferase [Pirellulales bacterium]|nr:UDP-N-acetylglucosamine--N-acetylmuramyl-(pentapeptide) pyrophosphoryl-undecaprenol N-acetylglucosamine transferase [Pirellulales bacterium]